MLLPVLVCAVAGAKRLIPRSDDRESKLTTRADRKNPSGGYLRNNYRLRSHFLFFFLLLLRAFFLAAALGPFFLRRGTTDLGRGPSSSLSGLFSKDIPSHL